MQKYDTIGDIHGYATKLILRTSAVAQQHRQRLSSVDPKHRSRPVIVMELSLMSRAVPPPS